MILRKGTIAFIIHTLLVCSLLNLFGIMNCTASGATIYVDDSNTVGPWDGTQNYPYQTIHEGITAASAGDMVMVLSGVYSEKIIITKDLTLRGESKDTTYIDGGGSGHTINAYGTSGNDITVVISNFTIRNAGGSGFDCITFSYIADGEISNNKILNSQEGEGISIDHCQGLTINGNVISNNNVAGINLILSVQNIITDNTVQNNPKGIQLGSFSTNNTIRQNTIRDNTVYGIYVIQSSNNVFSQNDFTGNSQNAKDTSTNSWSSENKGNYWEDYNKYDNNSDGIGDTPYYISGGSNKDDYPLGYFIQPEQPGGGNQQPLAITLSISKSIALFGETILLNGEGTDVDGYIIGYQYRSSLDGILSNEKSFSTSTLSLGTHTIYFKVMDDDSCWSTEKTASITINYGTNVIPIAFIDEITPNPVTLGETVVFQGHGSDEDGNITSYKWLSSKDGIIGTTSSFSITTLSIGTHTIYFQVKDDIEWSSQVTATLIVEYGSSGNPDNQAPVADVGGPYQGQVNEVISFDGSGSYDVEGDLIAHWDFGDNMSGNGLRPTHVYSNIGTYFVTLQVTDENGVCSTASTSVVIGLSASSGDTPEGFSLFNIKIPFHILVIVVFFSVLVAIVGFIIWLRRR